MDGQPLLHLEAFPFFRARVSYGFRDVTKADSTSALVGINRSHLVAGSFNRRGSVESAETFGRAPHPGFLCCRAAQKGRVEGKSASCSLLPCPACPANWRATRARPSPTNLHICCQQSTYRPLLRRSDPALPEPWATVMTSRGKQGLPPRAAASPSAPSS